MIDLETLGTASNSVILQIGACHFDLGPGDEPHDTFERTVTIDSCLRAGLIVNGSTVEWWLHQSETARHSVTEPNAVGIPTKHFPARSASSYFRDRTMDFPPFQQVAEVFVPAKIGTGLTELPRRAPRVHRFLLDLIRSLEKAHGTREEV